jgi:hypothetical protein
VPSKVFVPPTEEEKADPNYVEPEPIKLKIPKMTRDGNFDIQFSQKLAVPDFIKQKGDNDTYEARRLQDYEEADDAREGVVRVKLPKIPLEELDVSRDLFNVRFILNCEIKVKDIIYFLQIKKWDGDGLELSFNFSNPLLIS